MDEQDSGTTESNHSSKATTPRHKKRVLITVLIIILVALLCGGYAYYQWYRKQDHSVYGKLTTENYNKNGVIFSFSYPKILQSNPAIATKIPDAPVAFTYYTNQAVLQAVVAAEHESIGSTLKVLGISSSKYISQIRSGSGSLPEALDSMQHSASGFKKDFPGCNQSITTNSGKKTVLCVYSVAGHTYVREIGATSTTQYTLIFIMQPSVWTAHQKVWQKTLRSFSFR